MRLPTEGYSPLVVVWEVTRACPLACRHCREAPEHVFHPAELTHREGLELIDDLAASHPGALLVLSGGEPLSRPDTLSLARTATERGLSVALSVDVGWLLTPEVCDEIRDAGVATVSFKLQFADSAESDAFANAPGFHEAALAGLANLRASGQPFELQTTAMRSNAGRLPAIHRLAIDVGAERWRLFFPVPAGRGRLLAGEELSPGERCRVAQWLERLQPRSPIPVTARPSEAPHGCQAGNELCFVSHTGEVQGCSFLPLSVGNVRDEPLSKLYQTAPLLRAFRDPARRGDCRARAYATTGDPLAGDPEIQPLHAT